MKNLQQLCAALVLTLMLTLSAFAGDITTMIAPPPSTPQATAAGDITTGVAGDISTTVAGQIETGVASANPATDLALSLLQGVLTLI